jgi:hypothetical protein
MPGRPFSCSAKKKGHGNPQPFSLRATGGASPQGQATQAPIIAASGISASTTGMTLFIDLDLVQSFERKTSRL